MRKTGAFFGLVAGLAFTDVARASDENTTGAEPSKEEVPLVPYRNDTLGGHFLASARGAFVAPFGRVSDEAESLERSGNAVGLGLHLGYGLDRYVSAGIYGELELHGASGRCLECSANGFGAGVEVQYHLSQGLRLNPWLSYGLGFRGLASEVNGENLHYGGLEWLRISVGADWFALSQLGFGPFLQFGAASMFNVPSQEDRGGASWRFMTGLNVLLDLPGK